MPTRVRELGGFVIREFRLRGRSQMPRHEHPEPMLVLMTGGVYRGSARRDDYALEAGEGLVAPAARDHRGTVGENGSSALLVSWTDARRGNLRRAGLDRLRRLRGPGHTALTRRIRREFSCGDAVAAIALEGAILDLLATIARSVPAAAATPPPWIAEIRELLDADIANPPGLEVIASTVGVSRSHLNRVFKQAMGVTIGRYIRERRMEIAVSQLRSTRLPITRIALDLGFTDQSHFTRTFAAAVGTTPGRYRRSVGR